MVSHPRTAVLESLLKLSVAWPTTTAASSLVAAYSVAHHSISQLFGTLWRVMLRGQFERASGAMVTHRLCRRDLAGLALPRHLSILPKQARGALPPRLTLSLTREVEPGA